MNITANNITIIAAHGTLIDADINNPTTPTRNKQKQRGVPIHDGTPL